MTNRVNVLFITCDQYRGDTLSCQNHPDVKTPNLDTIAASGTLFDHAYAACPSCIPARAALLTGMNQRHTQRVGYEDCIDWNYSHYLAEEMTKNGYQTACIGKMHVHPPRLSCGFETLRLHDGYLGCYRNANIPHWMHQEVHDDYLYDLKKAKGPDADYTTTGPECNSWVMHPWIYEEELHPTHWTVDQSIRFLETRDRTRPFFLMTSFVRPHQPLDPPQSFLDLYINKELADEAHGDWDPVEKTEELGQICNSIYGCSDEELRHQAKAGYYASITHVDTQIGRLIQALKEQGVYKDTLILFASDHGEMLFDHGLWRKVYPYQGSIRVPLIISPGKNIGKGFPKHSSSVVELRDIMPTILDFCNVPIPETVDGLSLKQELLENKPIDRDYIHGEHSFENGLSNHYIVTKTDKFIWYSETGQEQYFHLETDPTESHDAIADPEAQDRIALLRSYLIDELKDREEGYSDGTQLIKGKQAVVMLKNTYK